MAVGDRVRLVDDHWVDDHPVVWEELGAAKQEP